ncbi:hypothetical protein Y032_0252g236 [Ancylostoma ceylanicum]|uniref:ADP-ribosylation factor family protein n=1 Tax=Ancylostoma ceylanicum TaxID=53326 RepID=A0A016SBU4_9BILA|nr:hypothetical protein Y032_0252g236 [Ancylostoma ceylanicum]
MAGDGLLCFVETSMLRELQVACEKSYRPPVKNIQQALCVLLRSDVEATIFVVDSSDNGSICEACEEIVDLLKIPELQGIALLIFANKQDTEDCMSAGEITSGLKLQNIKDREVSARFQC